MKFDWMDHGQGMVTLPDGRKIIFEANRKGEAKAITPDEGFTQDDIEGAVQAAIPHFRVRQLLKTVAA